MKISARTENGVTILDLLGNIKTPGDMEEFSTAIETELGRNNLKLLLNFQEVGFVNSSGLGRLVLAAKKVGERGGTMKVTGLAQDLDELFTFTRLKEKIGVFKSEAEALRNF
ncbi:MAG: STAS domain-containing protein [Nitrospinae bacterium]|nr:STAS domain-containing protein [Nitrospinota bacterium]